MIIKLNRFRIILPCIILLALLLRLMYLGKVPEGLAHKEAILGFRVQSLINTKADEFARVLPLTFFNERKLELPLPTYISVPFVAISPSNPSFLRLPFAISGIFFVLGAIMFTKKLFPKDEKLALLVGLIIAISPWAIWQSRIVSEMMLGGCFFIWGFYLFLNKSKLGIFLLILSALSSISWLMFIILFSIVIFYTSSKKIWPMFISLSLITVLVLITPDVVKSLKINEFLLLSDTSYLNDVNLLRGQNISDGFGLLGKIFFNKSFLLIKILQNYLSYFSLSFIFTRGDGIALNSLLNFGLFLLTFVPFFILGLIHFFKTKPNYFSLILVWLIITPVPLIFMSPNPQTDKFFPALFPLALMIALGLRRFKKVVLFVSLFFIFYNLLVVSVDTLVKESNRSLQTWNIQTLRIADFLENKTSQKIWLSDKIDQNPGPAIAYHLQISSENTNLPKSNIYDSRLSRLENIEIGDFEKLKKERKNYELIIASIEESKQLSCTSKGFFEDYVFLTNCL